jgi:ketosteroid isomerase-like protein
MAQENIDRLRASYETFSRTDEYDIDLLAPDFEMHQASSIIDTAGVFRREALRDAWRELQESFEELSMEVEKFIEAPDGKVFVYRAGPHETSCRPDWRDTSVSHVPGERRAGPSEL